MQQCLFFYLHRQTQRATAWQSTADSSAQPSQSVAEKNHQGHMESSDWIWSSIYVDRPHVTNNKYCCVRILKTRFPVWRIGECADTDRALAPLFDRFSSWCYSVCVMIRIHKGPSYWAQTLLIWIKLISVWIRILGVSVKSGLWSSKCLLQNTFTC